MKKQETINQYAKVTCYNCGETYPLKEVNNDSVRFFRNGEMVKFWKWVEQKTIDKEIFLCECCEDDRIEKEEEF
jgi:hypothetical protein